jgi:hypothetical protein
MNKDIIPKDSRYIPLTQQQYCCVPTCIQMVMLKHNIPLVPAELIGYHMGLIVPKNKLNLFWNGRAGKKPPAGFGTQLDKEYNPNTSFKKLNIPLKMSWNLINNFHNIEEINLYLTNIENKDILICFDWGTLFNKKHHNGHVCLIDKVYPSKKELRIIDPEYDVPKWRIIKTEKLFEAMKFHGQKNCAGFWELNLIK